MIEDQPSQHGNFNERSLGLASVEGNALHTMAFVIDIQDTASMSTSDADGYLTHLGETIERLRDTGAQVSWMTMGKGTPEKPYAKVKLFEPDNNGGDPALRDMNQLIDDMDFNGGQEEGVKGARFQEFLQDHGPLTSEAVNVKFFKSGFVTPEDYAENSDLRDIVASDYREGTLLPEAGDIPGGTFREYVDKQNPQQVLIMGAVSSHCIVENTASVIQEGLEPVICIDGVLSWDGENDSGMTDNLTWREGFGSKEEAQAYHEGKIRDRIAEIVSDPRRDLSAEQKDQLTNVKIMTADEYMQSLANPALSAENGSVNNHRPS